MLVEIASSEAKPLTVGDAGKTLGDNVIINRTQGRDSL